MAEQNYGLTPAQYDALVQKQKGHCAICQKLCSDLCVDHCHKSGITRELLCKDCNLGLGRFKDDILILESAVKYLRKYKDKTLSLSDLFARI